MSERRDELLRAAIDYAKQGWPVFPVRPGGKRPACRNGLHDATTDESIIRGWWEHDAYNIGLPTGSASGVVVVDIDGEAGKASAERLAGELQETRTVTTGRGRHLYYRQPDEPVQGGAGEKGGLAEGIDLRADGQYVVAPPSVHESGVAYTSDDAPMAACPQLVIEKRGRGATPTAVRALEGSVRARLAPRARVPVTRRPRSRADGRQALETVSTELAETPEGGRNDQLNSSALQLGKYVPPGLLDEDEVRAALREACEANGLLADDGVEAFDLTLRSGLEAGKTDPHEKVAANSPRERRVDGATFILDTPDTVPALWGRDQQVLWSEGEPLYVVAPPGVGKTTLAGQVVLHRLGIRDGELLGLPVAHTDQPVLYLAMDRPAQIARSLRRGVGPEHREVLSDQLAVWKGPPPFTIESDPREFARWVQSFGDIGTVVVDSLKDLSVSLENPESGAAVHTGLQECIAEGIEVLVLHHQRKATSDNRKPKSLADVYGSTWLTAGAGSVVLLWGSAGDAVVDLSHLKQPVEAVGPFEVTHDHARMVSTISQQVDPLEFVRMASTGVSARALAQATYESSTPKRADVERARRALDGLVRRGLVQRHEADSPSSPTIYRAAAGP